MGCIKRSLVFFTIVIGAGLFCGIRQTTISFDEQVNSMSSEVNKTSKFRKHYRRSLLSTAVINEKQGTTEEDLDLDALEMKLPTEEIHLSYSDTVPTKSMRRVKREIDKEYFDWKLNLNITRYNKTTRNHLDKTNAIPHSEKDSHLNMAIYVEGNGPKKSYNDLGNALNSIETLLQNLFGNVDELAETGHDLTMNVAFPNDGKRSDKLEGNLTNNTLSKGKEGRFFTGFFGFDWNGENPAIEGSGESLEVTGMSIQTEPSSNIQSETSFISEGKDEISEFDVLPSILNATEQTGEDNENKIFSSSSVAIPNLTSTTLNTIAPASNISGNKLDISNLTECSDCDLESISAISSELPVLNLETGFSTISSAITNNDGAKNFMPNEFQEFCTSLFNRVQKSARSLDELETEGSGSANEKIVGSTTHEGILNESIDEPKHQGFGISLIASLWNRIIGTTSRKKTEINMNMADELQIDNLSEGRNARFLNLNNLFGGFGSGRSVQDELGNVEFDEINLNMLQNTIFDCEKLFMNMQIESSSFKQNNPDLTTDADFIKFITTLPTDKLQLNTEHKSTSELNLEETTLENARVNDTETRWDIKNGSNKLTVNLSVDTTDLNTVIKASSTEKDARSFGDFIGSGEGPFFIGKPESVEVATEILERIWNNGLASGETRNLVSEQSEDPISLNEYISTHSSNTISGLDEQTIATLTKDGRFFLNRFGSGSDESEIGSAEIAEKHSRLNWLFNVGSGERVIQGNEVSSSIETEIDQFSTSTNIQERISPVFWNFGSGERRLNVEIQSTSEQNIDLPATIESDRDEIFEFGFGNDQTNFIEAGTATIATEESLFSNVPVSKLSNKISRSEVKYVENNDITTEPNNRIHIALSTIQPDYSKSDIKSVKSDILQISTENNREDSFNGFVNRNHVKQKYEEIDTSIATDCRNCSIPSNPTDSDTACNECGLKVQSDQRDIFMNHSLESEVTGKTTSRGEIQLNSISTTADMTNPTMSNRISETSVNEMTTVQHKLTRNDYSINHTDDLLDIDMVEVFPEAVTEVKDRRRFTQFLTGSGLGGFFEDDIAQINFILEPDGTTLSAAPSRRRGRLDDEQTIFLGGNSKTSLVNQAPNEFSKHSTVNNDFTTVVTTTEPMDKVTLFQNFEDSSETETTFVKDFSTASTLIYFKESSSQLANNFEGVSSTTDEAIASLTSTMTYFNVSKTNTEPKLRSCTSASQCDSALNERCIFSGSTAACKCGRNSVRHPETGKCETSVKLKTSMKLPGEAFHPDLKVRKTERFQKKRRDSIETMHLLLGHDPELLKTLSEVDVSGFEEGSLIVHWDIVLAVEQNESISEVIEKVDVDLKEAFEDKNLVKNVPLNVENADLLSVKMAGDLCEKRELNYCSKDAHCLQDDIHGFKCQCKEGYLDKSSDKQYPGEMCIEFCPASFCSDHGQCNLKPNGEMYCLCSSWYFGEKCEIPGIAVIAGFSVGNVLVIICLLWLVCFCKKRRYRRSRYYGDNQIRFQPTSDFGHFSGVSPRVADTIALDEVGLTKTKYINISTPKHVAPKVAITSPSVIGSSGSYEFDSTFDQTPSIDTKPETPKSATNHPV